jgi:hypothetical protein
MSGETHPLNLTIQEQANYHAAHNGGLVEALREWLTAPTAYDRPRHDRLHDNECERYQKGLHFTTDEDCNCSLKPVLAALAALEQAT